MMPGYAQVRDLKRMLLPVPVLTPRLSSYWVHIVTPIPAGIARPLIDGLRNEVIVRTDTASKLFSEIYPMDYKSAVGLAYWYVLYPIDRIIFSEMIKRIAQQIETQRIQSVR